MNGLAVAQELGLSNSEYEKIEELLKREPNYTELGLFSAMWSEHCSYKNSKKLLKLLPKEGKKVFIGIGENSGAVSVSDDYAIVFKVESHNHPSAVQPYEASATGGGGCIRDIFSVGASTKFLLSSLRFGSMENERTVFLFKEIARGFTDYANKIGFPALAGEVYCDDFYQGNPLVNAMVVGILKKSNQVKAKAEGVGNLVLMVGGPTGRDGVEGASFASAGLDENSTSKTGAVAIGDPEIGRVLEKTCLEITDKKLIVGMQDMGAAGLVCSTAEMAYNAGTGIEIDISFVSRKEEGMTPYEVMLSESQERMLLIIKPENLSKVEEIFNKWKVDSKVIGKVIADKILRVKEKGILVAEVPPQFLAEGPEYTRETKEPEYLARTRSLDLEKIKESQDYNQTLNTLLSYPTLASKEWITKKVDSSLLKGSCISAGGDTAVYHISEINKPIAATVDGNGLYCYLDPFTGGKISVAQAARNLVCCGAEPLGVTDGLNFGSPYNPEVYWQFEKVISGITEACKALDVPVVSGNVSFNNESPKGAIYPTPVIGMVGVIADAKQVTSQDFKDENDLIFLLGENKEELGGSQYLRVVHNLVKGLSPQLDLAKEKGVQAAALETITSGIAKSAKGCSEGGLAVALAESCIVGQKGASVNIDDDIRKDALLFGETQSRIIISVSSDDKDKIIEIAKKYNVSCKEIGKVKGDSLEINDLINVGVSDLDKTYKQAIPKIVEN